MDLLYTKVYPFIVSSFRVCEYLFLRRFKMKSNRIIWGIISLVVLTTIAVSFGTLSSHSQQKSINQSQPTPTPGSTGFEDLTKYAVADYDAPASNNAAEREERKTKSKRYDNQDFVVKNPNPKTGMAKLFDAVTPPVALPVAESNLIIIGEIINASAYLSNDKRNVYSEYNVRVNEILKEDSSNKIFSGNCISMDRRGGYVRYPNGQKVLYLIDEQNLPGVGSRYVLFLISDKQSPNYEILTGYELKENKIIPLDTVIGFDSFTGINELNFIKAVRDKISEPAKTVKN